MPSISPSTLLLQCCGAVIMAAILHYFYRLYGLRYLLLWRRSWLALSLHLASGLILLYFMHGPDAYDATLRLFISVVCFFAGFAQINWLLLGTYELATGKSSSRLYESIGLVAALLLTLGLVLPFAFESGTTALSARVQLRLTGRTFVTGIAFIGGAFALLYAWRQKNSLGLRLVGAVFALYGLHNLTYSVVWAANVSEKISAYYAGFFDALAQSAMGLGLIIWLLEEERHRAVGATLLLRESHARIKDLAGKLLIAQEEERRYIARELHDDLNQQVASLALGLGKLERQLPEANESVRAQIAKLEDRTNRLCDRIRRLSHELHSSTLEHVGLEAALRSLCTQFSEQEDIRINFEAEGGAREVCSALLPDVAHCLYRVAQESLRNIAKHSGAKSAEVKLSRTNGWIEMSIADAGSGFDFASTSLRRGLGLVSMEERVGLVRGSVQLRTRPGQGTEVNVRIPLTVNS